MYSIRHASCLIGHKARYPSVHSAQREVLYNIYVHVLRTLIRHDVSNLCHHDMLIYVSTLSYVMSKLGWRIIHTQLTPRHTHTMPAHGSSHHGWRIIHTQCRHTAAHTTGGESYTHNASTRQLTPRMENHTPSLATATLNQRTMRKPSPAVLLRSLLLVLVV